MSSTLSSKNPYYNYKIIDNTSDFLQEKSTGNDLVVSYYVCSGELSFECLNKKIKIIENEVVIISSANNLSNFQLSKNSKVF